LLWGLPPMSSIGLFTRSGARQDSFLISLTQACVERDCYPSPLNYRGFPKSCCTSVNEIICHGIPDLYKLANGDIVNSLNMPIFCVSSCFSVDVSVYHRGFHTDLNETYFVGQVDEESKHLVKTTYECLQKSIEQGN
jgi:methionyl aminopeptidase